MICLMVTVVLDTSIIKIYDLSYKYFISMKSKIILFAINSSLCLFIQYFTIYYIRKSVQKYNPGQRLLTKFLDRITLISLTILATSLAVLTIQMFYHGSYDSWIIIFIISLTYGTASVVLIILCKLFISWYRSKHELLVLLYFLSISIIVINFIVTAVYTCTNISERPEE